MTDATILAGLDDHVTKWSKLAAQYYQRRNGEAGKQCDEYAAIVQAAAKRLRELSTE